jgi:ribose transport system substrate-binding protein
MIRFSRLIFAALAVGTLAGNSARIAAAAERTIGFALPDLADSFWVSAAYGVDDEAGKLGVKVIKLNAGADTNSTQQISQIQDLIQRKVDAIIVGATNGDAVKAVVERAIKAGIPVVGISSPPNSKKLAAVITADHYDMGRLQAECLSKAMGGKGNVALVGGPSGQAWADIRIKGFKDTLKKSFPEVKVIAESRTALNRAAALKTTEDWIQRFPDLHGVYAAYDDLGAGVVAALQAAKRDDIKVSTSNLSQTASDLLAKGQLACTSIQQIVAQGRAALQQAVAAAEKKAVKANVTLPALLVTADNLKSIDLSNVTAPASYHP